VNAQRTTGEGRVYGRVEPLTVVIMVDTNREIVRWCLVQYLQVFKTVGERDAKLQGTCRKSRKRSNPAEETLEGLLDRVASAREAIARRGKGA